MTKDKIFKNKLLIILIIIGIITLFCLDNAGDKILFLTFLSLLWYTWETKKIREQTVLQTELATMPIMSLYIRNVSGIDEADEDRRRDKINKLKQYAITQEVNSGINPSQYYIALRNMGDGTAFNVEVESENFKAEKYQTRFFAPKKDEHAVKIIKKPSNKIRNINEIKDEIFIIRCQSVLGKNYEYEYKIKNVEGKEVEFIK